jgi:hypothetical protein
MDIAKEVMSLNKRVGDAKNNLTRLQTQRDMLIRNRSDLYAEITKAGFNPDSLDRDRQSLESEILSMKKAIETELTKAESVINSIKE